MEMLQVPGWYMVYTKPLSGRKVAGHFSREKIEHYYPMKKVKREEPGDVKITYEPLFTSHIFVYVSPAGLDRVKMINGVISLVHWQESPVIIPEDEIDTIKKILNHCDDVILEKIPVNINAGISVAENPVLQKEVMNGLVKVQLPSLGYALKAKINRRLITTIPVPQPESYLTSKDYTISEGLQMSRKTETNPV